MLVYNILWNGLYSLHCQKIESDVLTEYYVASSSPTWHKQRVISLLNGVWLPTDQALLNGLNVTISTEIIKYNYSPGAGYSKKRIIVVWCDLLPRLFIKEEGKGAQ